MNVQGGDRDPVRQPFAPGDSGEARATDARAARLDRWAAIQALAESLARCGLEAPTSRTEGR